MAKKLTPSMSKKKGKRKQNTPKKWTWKKAHDKPKRPLSAYNYFFQEKRAKILAERETARANGTVKGGVGFEGLTRTVAKAWRELEDISSGRDKYIEMAEKDMVRYKRELEEWTLKQCHASVTDSESSWDESSRGDDSRASLGLDDMSVVTVDLGMGGSHELDLAHDQVDIEFTMGVQNLIVDNCQQVPRDGLDSFTSDVLDGKETEQGHEGTSKSGSPGFEALDSFNIDDDPLDPTQPSSLDNDGDYFLMVWSQSQRQAV